MKFVLTLAVLILQTSMAHAYELTCSIGGEGGHHQDLVVTTVKGQIHLFVNRDSGDLNFNRLLAAAKVKDEYDTMEITVSESACKISSTNSKLIECFDRTVPVEFSNYYGTHNAKKVSMSSPSLFFQVAEVSVDYLSRQTKEYRLLISYFMGGRVDYKTEIESTFCH